MVDGWAEDQAATYSLDIRGSKDSVLHRVNWTRQVGVNKLRVKTRAKQAEDKSRSIVMDKAS